jgi:hypothetical protein
MLPRLSVLCKAAILLLVLGLAAGVAVSAGKLAVSTAGVALGEGEEVGGGGCGAALGDTAGAAAFGVGGDGKTNCSVLSRANRSFTLMPPEAVASGLDVCAATVFGLLPLVAAAGGVGGAKIGDPPLEPALRLAILLFTLGVVAASLPALLS